MPPTTKASSEVLSVSPKARLKKVETASPLESRRHEIPPYSRGMAEVARKRRETGSTLYGPHQSRFARYLEQRERERPDPVARGLRRQLLAGLRGRVLEVGCGDGRSFEHYPTSVTQLVAVEPDPTARAVAAERARATAVAIDVVEGTAEALPAQDGSLDAVVVMGLLCTVPDPAATLAEVRRVLKPTGELRFWEHVRSRHLPLRLLQRSLDALFWTRALGGCRTTRDTEAAIATSGFELVSLERGFHASSPLTITAAPYIIGIARPVEARSPRSRT
jgi:SAM-dependent methyltransferase